MSIRTMIGLGALVMTMGVAAPAAAQVTLEARGGINVPTFDVADVAKAGPSFGAGIGYFVTPRVTLMADADFGFHSIQNVTDAKIKVFHYMGKFGFELLPNNPKLSLVVNAGAGAMTFNPDGGSSSTYFAINAGAKLGIALSSTVDILISPQGDIAFTDENEIGSSMAWVWPVSAGLRFRF